ncbi:class I SAM-dependent methyltransferase [Amphibacillus marinus]|nr:class I SAM-dependent methyltransferase [Amphibacillus marinus]
MNYLNFLSKLGIGGAHPGGIELTRDILTCKEINKGATILDVGCGTGQTIAYLVETYDAHVTGIDINPNMVIRARERMIRDDLDANILHGSVEALPVEDAFFDIVLAESVLAFVNQPKALTEIYRVLKPNGSLIANELTINEPLPQENEQEIQAFYGFESILLENDWLKLFKQAGFKNVNTLTIPNLFQNQSVPEFDFSLIFKPELYEMMVSYYNITMKYMNVLDYRVFAATKVI